MRIAHLGCDEQLEFLVVVDLLVSYSDQQTIILFVGLFLQHRVDRWFELFLDVLEED